MGRGYVDGPWQIKGVWLAQVDDLLIALAERRSLPDTRFFVARGIVGETWSVESAAGGVTVETGSSELVLPLREPSLYSAMRPLTYFNL